MASCCTWSRSMTASSSFEKVLPGYANSTVQPVFSATQSDRDDAIAAVIATGILQPETSLLATSFKTADNLDTRMLRPFHDGPLPNCPFGISLSQNATSSCSPIFAEPQRWPSHAA